MVNVGDFLFATSDSIVRIYERKAFPDFVSSLVDNRLFEQVKRMIDTVGEEFTFLLLEGKEFLERDDIRGMSRSAIDGAISFCDSVGIHLLYSRDREDSARIIQSAFDHIVSGKTKLKGISSRKIADKGGRLFIEVQKDLLTALPSIGDDRAFAILKEYGTVKSFFDSMDDEEDFCARLGEVRGISAKAARLIFKIVHGIDDGTKIDGGMKAEIQKICALVAKSCRAAAQDDGADEDEESKD